MANTTNFGWETPDDTDLVKDGAAAIRTLGSAIDTSLVDLKGGTTGQILSKTSNTDMDFTWITNDVGDITAVTAGTGISGGGTTGAVTITNDMATTITAAGDIVVGTGNATYDNLPIGTTGQVLTADTTVSPYKVKWATPAGSLTLSQIASGSMPAAQSLTVSSLSSYDKIIIQLRSVTNATSSGNIYLRVNGNSTSNYQGNQFGSYAEQNYTPGSIFPSSDIIDQSFFRFVSSYSPRHDISAHYFIVLDNCKAAGFTSYNCTSVVSIFNGTSSHRNFSWTSGLYTVAEAVSSFTITQTAGGNWNGGTYVVWGG